METARPVMNVISSNEGQNLADSLASKEMADKSIAALWWWSKGRKVELVYKLSRHCR